MSEKLDDTQPKIENPISDADSPSEEGEKLDDTQPKIENPISDADSPSEEVEPKLKFMRLYFDLHKILEKESATCLAVHPKFICMGGTWGGIHLLDHFGNAVLRDVHFQDKSSSGAIISPSGQSHAKNFQDNVQQQAAGKSVPAHSVDVNQISIDRKGDFIATCSDDGKVYVHGLYTTENNHYLSIGRLVKSIAIDPNYYKPGSGRRFITGDERLVLHEKTFLSRVKSTVLCEAEGLVQNIKWNGQFVAWASDYCLRVYDINARCSLGVFQWMSSSEAQPQDYRCNLCWKDNYTLLVGWIDRVRICVIRRRIPQEITSRDPSDFFVEETSTFQTDFFIAGIGPLGNQLVLLGFEKEPNEDGTSQRPALHVIEPHGNDYIEINLNCLSLRGYKEYKCNNYHLECITEVENFFVVSPKDIIMASPCDADDRVQWLVNHCKYEEAMDALRGPSGRSVKEFTLLKVGCEYVDYLLNLKEYDQAAKICQSILGKDKRLWEEAVLKFGEIKQLRAISKYLPRSEFRLDSSIYEMVMYEFLNTDAAGFLELVKEWPAHLYRVTVVINAVLQHLLKSSENLLELLEALALLYGHDHKYNMALSMYLKIRHKGVFQMINIHGLKGPVIHNLILELVELDPNQAIAMLLEKVSDKDKSVVNPKDKFGVDPKDRFVVDPSVVVSKLSAKELYLYMYLHELEAKNGARKYHGLLVRLYADFSRDNLLPLLRRSDHYRISDALKICEERKFYPEMVFLLGRIGKTKEALQLITHSINNIDEAIDFCKEHSDDELWEDLIAYSLKKPEFITTLLQRIGSYIDPRILVQRMDPNVQIPGLKNSLVKMMRDYKLQVSVQEGCRKLLTSDYFNLHEKLVRMQNRGILVDDEQECGKCHESVIINDEARGKNIVVFCCKHVFHQYCLPTSESGDTYCIVCNINVWKTPPT